MEDCVYHKFIGSKSIFLVLYIDDTLITCNYGSLLYDTKRSLKKNFEMNDLGDAHFVLET